MTSPPVADRHGTVAIVGGGLAGMAVATALCQRGLHVELFESRRVLGGRAASFEEKQTSQYVDYCQHVSMGCCTNLQQFCRQVGIADLFRRERTLHFIAPDGRQSDLTAARWLPAPLHLAIALGRLSYLGLRDRIAVARSLLKLARQHNPTDEQTIAQWLHVEGQSTTAIDRFWKVVLVSALGETLDRVSVRYARKVFVDGFLANTQGYEVLIPQLPLREVFSERIVPWLEARDAKVHLGTPIREIVGDAKSVRGVRLPDGSLHQADVVVAAVPLRRCRDLFPRQLAAELTWLDGLERISSSPITGVHLWFDRPITSLPHAVFVDRLSQWMFNRGAQPIAANDHRQTHYCQVVISASRQLASRDREDIAQQIAAELRSAWPAARDAQLVHWRVVTDHDAVFSVDCNVDRYRPAQQTAIPNLVLAGDWTATGWPSTMEGAVRSGYLAAEAVLCSLGRDEPILVDDLPRGRLAKLVCGGA